jgi:hypothetical protein
MGDSNFCMLEEIEAEETVVVARERDGVCWITGAILQPQARAANQPAALRKPTMQKCSFALLNHGTS